MDSKVTVIITVYNNEEYLRRCIGSVIAQDYDLDILAVLDMSSSDKSEDILKHFKYNSFSKRLFILPVKKCWVGKARNEGASWVKTPYIIFLDGDDTLPEGSVRRMMEVAEKEYSDCVFGKTAMVYPNGKKKVWDGVLRGRNGSYVAKTFLHPVLYDRELYDTHLKCLENIKTHEDRLSGYLITKYARNPVYVEEELYNYHVNPGSSIRRKDIRIKMIEDIVEVLRELDKHQFTEEEKEIVMDDMLWSALTTLVYIMNEENPRPHVETWLSAINFHIPNWQNYPNAQRILKEKYVFRDLVKIMTESKNYEEAAFRFSVFPKWKKNVINIMSEIYVYGGIKNYIKLKVHEG